MFNFRKGATGGRRRNRTVTDEQEWRLELKPVQVDNYHNLHAIYHRQDGSTTSELLMTELSRSQVQAVLTAALSALRTHFDEKADNTRYDGAELSV